MATGIATPTDNQLFLPEMTVQAMRDSRYRHPANAIAELIDNSIDARADNVELLIQEKQVRARTLNVWRVHKIAVLDDGHGMSAETLVQALRFGGRQQTATIHRIGKYGMGLPTSSVSQCRRLDVWSWESDIDRAAHSYIDIDEIEAGVQTVVPAPQFGRPPDEWLNLAVNGQNEHSGTLVVWSNPDRITQRAETIFNHTEEAIGRIYRHFIDKGDVVIRMASFRMPDQETLVSIQAREDREVRPNDPLYLMTKTSVGLDGMPDPMFRQYGDVKEFTTHIKGRVETIRVTYSIAKPEILGEYKGELPGNRAYGRHALKNTGISAVRENREISLENYFVRAGGGNSIPQNRWWGCEVSFNRECDDLFGVDHNKQLVSHFASVMKYLDDNDGETLQMTMDLDSGEDDVINEVAGHIRNTTRAMMREINKMFSQRPRRPKPGQEGEQDDSPEGQAEDITQEATRTGLETGGINRTPTDDARERLPEDVKIKEIKDLLEESYTEEQAQDIAETLVRLKKWYKIIPAPLDGSQMFSFTSGGGVLTMKLNIQHPIYTFIQDIEDDAGENAISERAAIGILAMLLSWGRMEDDIENDMVRMDVQDRARSWGRMVSAVLSQINEDQAAAAD